MSVGGSASPALQISSPSSSILFSSTLSGGQSRCSPMILTVTALLLMTSNVTSWPSGLQPPRSSWLHTLGMVGVGTRVGTATVTASVGAETVVGTTGVVALGDG